MTAPARSGAASVGPGPRARNAVDHAAGSRSGATGHRVRGPTAADEPARAARAPRAWRARGHPRAQRAARVRAAEPERLRQQLLRGGGEVDAALVAQLLL